MIERIKNKIDELKNDKSSFDKYIKSFFESKKAIEYYESNEEFNKLKEKKETSQYKKEDEFF